MDALIDDDLDNNNNVIPILNNNNNQNQVNLNNPPVLDALQEPEPRQEQQQQPQPIDEHFNNINNSMENNRRENGVDIVVNLPPQNHLNAVNQIANHNNENQMNLNAMNNDENDANENGIDEHNLNLNRLNHENNQNIRPPTINHINNSNSNSNCNTTITNPTNVRKSKKRKRHYNVNKNKKWNKSYKRQKSTNTIKADAENAQQNNRNKHSYTKIPKIIFNNKQAIHRGSGLSKFFLPDKRPRKDIIVPPTKFLLGGNISDPLNLNSLQDEALSMSAVTPKSSPITTPPKVEVIIPPNIYDPLHLLDPVDSMEYEKRLVSPVKCRRLNKQRSRKKKIRKHSSGEQLPNATMENADFAVSTIIQATATTNTTISTATATTATATTAETISIATTHADTANASPKKVDASHECDPNEQDDGDEHTHSTINVDDRIRLTRDLQLDLSASSISSRKRKNSESGGCSNAGNSSTAGGSKNKLRRFDSKDKIVSPVIPQPGAWKRPPKVLPMGAPRNRIRTTSTSDNDNSDEPNSKRPESTATAEELKIGSSNVPVMNTGDLSPERTPSHFKCEIATPNTVVDNITFTAKNDGMRFKQESIKYQFGNYAGQYCGLQNLNNFSDVRLTVFMRHAYLFKDKDILDIGCNVGHMTIAVARRLHPKSIVGIDVDKNLIARARRNLSLFQRLQLDTTKINKLNNKIGGGGGCGENATHQDNMTESRSHHHDKEKQVSSTKKSKYHRARDRDKYEQNHVDFFPVSFPICFGGFPNVKQITETAGSSTSPSNSCNQNTAKPTAEQSTENSQTENATTATATKTESSTEVPSTSKEINDGNSMETTDSFPDNVFFRTLNYVLTDESQMVSDKQQYDLILCLSLTKWIHLNFGDAGLKLSFRRMFNQLRPGGKLILEAQNWASYRKRKKLTSTIYNNYKSIEFFPNKFHEYLLSPEVGFSHSYTLGVPRHASKGFYRPIQLYIKGDFTPSQVRWSDTYHPQTPYEPRVRYAHYANPIRRQYGSFGKYHNMSNMYKNRDTSFSMGANRYNTPSHGISSTTSRYYNPLETDSYLPSYDNVVPTRHYCFASPLYSTVWSPPASGRKSASQTPLFGSIRRVDADDQDMGTKHVYLTPRAFDHGSGSSRSIDESNSVSPQTPAIGSSRSVRDSDLDANTNSPKHVYAFQ